MAETTPHLKILEKLIHPEASTQTVTSVSQEFDDLTSTLVIDPESDAFHYHPQNTWKAIFEEIIPRTAPGYQSKLVEFVVQLQKKTVTNPATNQVLDNDGEALWADLPRLGLTLSFLWNLFGKNFAYYIEYMLLTWMEKRPAEF